MGKKKRGNSREKHEIQREEKGYFKKGVSANPAGKPPGTKNYLTRILKGGKTDKIREPSGLTGPGPY